MERYRGRRSPQNFCAVPSSVAVPPERKTAHGCGAIDACPWWTIESTTGAEAAAGEYLYAHLAALAARTCGVAERMAVTRERFNVLATWGTPVVTLSTHIDTVPPVLCIARRWRICLGPRSLRRERHHRSDGDGRERLLAAGTRNLGLLFVVGERKGQFGIAGRSENSARIKVLD